MWVGWNSRIQPGEDTCQKVWYLPQIDLSPTSNTVVAETLNIAQRNAKDTERDEISVTYDFAIAKLAMQIRAAESPRYDNVFVLIGAFHTEMAFFNALGKFIAESGGPSILVASETIASGSLKGFITGKHYNRCKRIHPLLAVAMEIESEYVSELLQMQDKNFSTESLSKELIEMIHMYLEFKENTRNGMHGKTAQYWKKHLDGTWTFHNKQLTLC